ncbi:MAG: tautomerase family protein [Betaproteobacteria bacterium]|nr:MAG: tautomerase family protein [Betaproteobacteria bacterium]
MAQVKIYGLRPSLAIDGKAISHAVHGAIVEALAYPPEKKFHRLFALEADEFVFPADRSNRYTIIEISMFEGRSVDAKKTLIRTLFSAIERATGITPHDVEITLFETPKHHWGIRGMCGDELALGYKVNV